GVGGGGGGGGGVAERVGVVVSRLHQPRRVGLVRVVGPQLLRIDLAVAVGVSVPIRKGGRVERDRRPADGARVLLDRRVELDLQVGHLARNSLFPAVAVEVAFAGHPDRRGFGQGFHTLVARAAFLHEYVAAVRLMARGAGAYARDVIEAARIGLAGVFVRHLHFGAVDRRARRE